MSKIGLATLTAHLGASGVAMLRDIELYEAVAALAPSQWQEWVSKYPHHAGAIRELRKHFSEEEVQGEQSI